MTKLSQIFSKPVDRPIDGVIKADDEISLLLELEEYVLTNEIEARFENFLDAYNNYAGANGAWISGFFGSGKSHLLKTLAILLENREIEGVVARELFMPKCEHNANLKAELRKAIAIPARSILFNIDQKATVIAKSQVDALLSVFVQVFDEHCGYYGKQAYIAKFERELDQRDQYGAFKSAFEEAAGIPWERGREQLLLEADNIATAYRKATGSSPDSARGILDKYRADYRLSIEDFAEEVNRYIVAQRPDFRLNFFVDEVGQYIADNTKLMTNLQTVAESLATKCHGRSWIIVTAQEDMSRVIGEMGKQHSHDYTKIQARFATRMKLTSRNVDEVIQKRLLKKNETGIVALEALHGQQANNFRTLFDFADGSQTYKNYRDRDDFIYCYPFAPYQFGLFQAAIQSLSEFGAFEGQHSSVGERSMLGVFQQVAITITEHQIGQLATFDLMFDGIHTALKAQIQRTVTRAAQQLGDDYAVRVLRALFLVKYVNEFKATLRNVSILMLDGFDRDLTALRKQVEEALNLLTQESYIQRNGDAYEFLTDEEQDVDKKIKQTEVDAADVADELGKLIFDQIIRERKIRLPSSTHDYSYTRKLDDRNLGREQELAIHVISPFHEHAGNVDTLRMQNMGKAELLVVMSPDRRLFEDCMLYKRTDKYIRQNISMTQQDSIKKILISKQTGNSDRHRDMTDRAAVLLGQATLISHGDLLDIGGEAPQSRIIKGFQELVQRAYPNLRMLRGIAYTENDVSTCLRQGDDSLLQSGDVIGESEQELLAAVKANKARGVRSSVSDLITKFEKKPYGWPYAAILCTLAKLCGVGKVEVRQDSNLLEEAGLERALCNNHAHANLVVDPQIDFTASQIRGLKDFYNDFFDQPVTATDAKSIGTATARAFLDLAQDVTRLQQQSADYPFLAALQEPAAKLGQLAARPYSWLIPEIPKLENELYELKENVLDPIRSFMGSDNSPGATRILYDQAQQLQIQHGPNFDVIEDLRDDAAELTRLLSSGDCLQPATCQRIKALADTLRTTVTARLTQERSGAIESVSASRDRMVDTDEYKKLSTEQQSQLRAELDRWEAEFKDQPLVAVIRDKLRRFEQDAYQRLLERMCQMAQPPAPPVDYDGDDSTPPPVLAEPTVSYVYSRAIKVDFPKPWLATTDDVDAYLGALREAMLAAIDDNKRIQL